jgi:hypothetical protein
MLRLWRNPADSVVKWSVIAARFFIYSGTFAFLFSSIVDCRVVYSMHKAIPIFNP